MKKYMVLFILFLTIAVTAKPLEYARVKKLIETGVRKGESWRQRKLHSVLAHAGITRELLDSIAKQLENSATTLSLHSLQEITLDTLWTDEETTSYELMKITSIPVKEDGCSGDEVCVILVGKNAQGEGVLKKAYILRRCRYVSTGVALLENDPGVYTLKITDALACRGRKEWSECYDTIVTLNDSLLYLPALGKPMEFNQSLLDDTTDTQYFRPYYDEETDKESGDGTDQDRIAETGTYREWSCNGLVVKWNEKEAFSVSKEGDTSLIYLEKGRDSLIYKNGKKSTASLVTSCTMLSVVVPYISFRRTCLLKSSTEERVMEDAFLTVNLEGDDAGISLCDIFSGDDIFTALKNDSFIRKKISGNEKTLKELLEKITETCGDAPHPEALLNSFSFHHVKDSSVAVRLGIAPSCIITGGKLLQLGIYLQIPSALYSSFRTAENKKLLMQHLLLQE